MTALTGTVKLALQSYSAALAAVSYSSRFALGIWYPPEAWHAVRNAGWRGKYVSPTDSDVVVWIALGSLNEAEHEGTLLCSSAPCSGADRTGLRGVAYGRCTGRSVSCSALNGVVRDAACRHGT